MRVDAFTIRVPSICMVLKLHSLFNVKIILYAHKFILLIWISDVNFCILLFSSMINITLYLYSVMNNKPDDINYLPFRGTLFQSSFWHIISPWIHCIECLFYLYIAVLIFYSGWFSRTSILSSTKFVFTIVWCGIILFLFASYHFWDGPRWEMFWHLVLPPLLVSYWHFQLF